PVRLSPSAKAGAGRSERLLPRRSGRPPASCTGGTVVGSPHGGPIVLWRSRSGECGRDFAAHRAIDGPMNRLLLIIALIFGFASVGGASAHAALPGSAAGLAVAGGHAEALDLCAVGETEAKGAAVFKPCSKKGKNGLAIFCDHQQAVLPRLVECLPPVVGL